MALTIKPSKTRLISIGIGLVIAITGLVFGTRMIGSRAAGEAPQAVTVTDITSTSATIKWETGTPIQGAVRYGKGTTDADLTAVAPELEPTKEHKVALNLLEAGTTYYFKIVGGSDTDFDNSGVPWDFTTATDSGTIPVSGTQKTNSKSIQHLVIPDDNTATTAPATVTPSINCKTETNCALIKANFVNGCSTADYVACTFRNAK